MARVKPSVVLRQLRSDEYEANLESSIQTYEYLGGALADTTVEVGEFFSVSDFSATRLSGPIYFQWVASGTGPQYHNHDTLSLVAELKPPTAVTAEMFETDEDALLFVEDNPQYLLVVNKEVNASPSIQADFVNQVFRRAGDFGLADTTFSALFNYTRASSGTRINHLKQVDTRAVNEHRISHDYETGEALGLLMEGQVTNLAIQSDNYFNAAWAKSALGTASAPIVTANVAEAPDGTISADRIYFKLNGGTASGDLSSIQQTIANTPGDRRESTYWLKSNTGTDQKVRISFSNNASNLPDTESFVTVTNDWQRFRVGIDSLVGTANSPRLSIRGSDAQTDDECDILAWRNNTYDNYGGPSSDTDETVASAVTRSADFCSLINGPDSLVAQGTIYVETIVPPDTVTVGGSRFLRLSDGTNTNRITLYKTTAGNISSFVVSAGVDTGVSLGNFDVGMPLKIALRYNPTEVTIYCNGTKYSAAFDTELAVVLDELDVGTDGAIADNAPIAKLETYAFEMTDDELRRLTL